MVYVLVRLNKKTIFDSDMLSLNFWFPAFCTMAKKLFVWWKGHRYISARFKKFYRSFKIKFGSWNVNGLKGTKNQRKNPLENHLAILRSRICGIYETTWGNLFNELWKVFGIAESFFGENNPSAFDRLACSLSPRFLNDLWQSDGIFLLFTALSHCSRQINNSTPISSDSVK